MHDLEQRPPFGDRGRTVHPRNPFAGIPGLSVALRLCVDQPPDGPPVSLAQLAKPVPEDYLRPVSVLATRRQGRMVNCTCGAAQIVPAGLVECEGGCGRWFASGETFGDVFAFRLPVEAAA